MTNNGEGQNEGRNEGRNEGDIAYNCFLSDQAYATDQFYTANPEIEDQRWLAHVILRDAGHYMMETLDLCHFLPTIVNRMYQNWISIAPTHLIFYRPSNLCWRVEAWHFTSFSTRLRSSCVGVRHM
jgi:hypothetical protein